LASAKLKIGSKAPSFNLMGTDGKFYSLESFNDKKILIIIFSCNHCPYVQAYENRIKAIQKDYADRSLKVIAINSNDDLKYPEDSFDEMKKRAKEKDFNFLYLRDEEQTAAYDYGATHTPQVFLFDEMRKLVYEGKIDDYWQEENLVKNKYLRNAIDELIENKEISVPETFSIGCTIKWK
jgi:peroxiredoxin